MNELFALAMGDRDDRVRQALERLRETHASEARLIELCSIEGKSYAAAAAELGLPAHRVRRHHYRALARLIRQMDDPSGRGA